MVAGSDEEFIRVYVDAEYGFVRDGKPVYPEYKDSAHSLDIEYQPGVTIYRGWDFGLTPASVLSQVLPDGRWNTFDELCATDEDICSFSELVQEHCAREYPGAKYEDIGDPAEFAVHLWYAGPGRCPARRISYPVPAKLAETGP